MNHHSNLYPLLTSHMMERTALKSELNHSAESAGTRWRKVALTQSDCYWAEAIVDHDPWRGRPVVVVSPGEGLHPIPLVPTSFLHFPHHLQGVVHSDSKAQSHPCHTLLVISKLFNFLVENVYRRVQVFCIHLHSVGHVWRWLLSRARCLWGNT